MAMQGGLPTTYGRRIEYLRVSVTGRCNLKCVYCRPEALDYDEHVDRFLTLDEIFHVVRVLAGVGLKKVRITGGEPLVRTGVVDLIRRIASLPQIQDLALSTNGMLLARYAAALKEAGLRRVNVSVDTLDAETFRRITGGGRLEQVLAGIAAAEAVGLVPIKLNCVVIRGINDTQVADLAALTREKAWHVRFIEYMPIGGEQEHYEERFVPAAETRARIEAALGPLEPVAYDGHAASRDWRLPGAPGVIGFITPMTEHFCAGCNRLRLTADGKVRACLLTDIETDLLAAMRHGITDEELLALLGLAAQFKPEHHEAVGHWRSQRLMVKIGG